MLCSRNSKSNSSILPPIIRLRLNIEPNPYAKTDSNPNAKMKTPQEETSNQGGLFSTARNEDYVPNVKKTATETEVGGDCLGKGYGWR